MTSFETFWRAYPRYAQRSKKAVSRALFEAITGPGLAVRVEGLTLHHKEAPATLIQAAKAYRMALLDASDPGEHEFKFAPACNVWLKQGRFEDHDPDERDRLAAKYDDLQARINRNKLEVVK